MEVMVGSSLGISLAAYVRGDRSGVSAQNKDVPAGLFLADESRRGGSQIGIGLRMCSSNKSPEESSDSSSSIGESSENEEEEEEDDDAVSYQGGALDSFNSSLEDSLPIKRGLSNHYVGKSKSFGNLMQASNNAKTLEKVENPFNKRRRLVIANKLRRRGKSLSVSNFYSWQNPNSMPTLLALQEHNEEGHNDDYEDDDDGDELLEKRKIMMMMKNKRDLMAQTQSCFCLSSLQEEDDDDNDEE